MGKEIVLEKQDKNLWQPVSFSSQKRKFFIKENPEVSTQDDIQNNLEELFLLRNPKYRFDKNYKTELENFLATFNTEDFGNWFYFPWLNSLIRYLPENLHQELRTGRNKHLITNEEQEQFYNATAVFLGMSVGSHAAIVAAMTGGIKNMKLVDPDIFSGDNLNRIRLGFQNIGLKKAVAVARQIYEINPYAKLEIYTEGINEKNAEDILENSDILVEEMDDMYWKIRVRELARMHGIPVLMGTDNGDGVIVDIERFDLNRKLPILNGRIGKLTANKLKSIVPNDLPKIAGKIAGANLAVPRMLYSLSEVGKSIYSWPQLGTAANMCGSVIAMLMRRILNKDKKILSKRYVLNPDSIFEFGYSFKWIERKISFLKFIWKMRS